MEDLDDNVYKLAAHELVWQLSMRMSNDISVY